MGAPMITTDQNVLGQNLALVAFAGTTALVYGSRLVTRLRQGKWDDSTRMMAGIVLVAASWTIHRAYWGIWRLLRADGNFEASAWFIDHGDWLILTVIGVLIGYTFHLQPILAGLSPRYWWAWGIVGAIGFWGMGAALPCLVF